MKIGASLGHYQVLAKIGAGGMGEVYRAHDTKLERDVAIKVLPEELASDPERVARFEREAKVLASLNHPNIAAIYGFEAVSDTNALVLELVEGPTLAERLERGKPPVDEALAIARQIAEALEYGHELGIIHRDLKPANVKVTEDGVVKVLDYGLAKALDAETAESGDRDLSQSPTLTRQGTEVGVILGTAAYMSPEQAKGRRVDRRADIWAFGAVLYEMLTGRRAFDGADAAEVLAEVIRGEGDFERLPADVPGSVRRLLERCLRKDPKKRLQHIGDARLELEEPVDASSAGPVARARTPWLALAGMALVGAVVAGLAATGLRPEPSEPRVVSFDLDAVGAAYLEGPRMTPPVVSPDGKLIAFVRAGGGGRIHLRFLDDTNVVPIEGTEGASALFWSPDSQEVGFLAEGSLKRVGVERGSRPEIICRLPSQVSSSNGTWSASGVILFENGRHLARVPASGGEPQVAFEPTAEIPRPRQPHFLPDGMSFLFNSFTAGAGVGNVYLSTLEGTAPRLVTQARNCCVRYAAGYLFTPGEYGTLLARPFDLDRLEVTGDAIPVATHDVGIAWSVSDDVLVVRNESAASGMGRLVRVGRDGTELGVLGEPGEYFAPRLSPDGTRLALEIHNDRGFGDVELLDLQTGRRERFSFAPDAHNSGATWSPDGDRIAFHSSRVNPVGIFVRPLSSAAEARRALQLQSLVTPTDWSPDGELLLFDEESLAGDWNLWVLPLAEGGEPRAFLQTEFNELQGTFSPDGRWVAYASDESGRFEIYLRPYVEGGDARFQITADGGEAPRFRGDGQELFYLAPGGRVMAVPLTLGERPVWETPQELFQRPVWTGTGPTRDLYGYDVTKDGQTFVINEGTSANVSYTVTVNWPLLLRRSGDAPP